MTPMLTTPFSSLTTAALTAALITITTAILLLRLLPPKQTTTTTAAAATMISTKPVKTSYLSKPVAVPATFLTSPAPSPPTYRAIDFSTSTLPEYTGAHAFVLDNVLSRGECAQLVELAEQSVRDEDYVPADPAHARPGDDDGDTDAWQPARVNVGPGYEVFMPDYRRGSRIIWDDQLVVDRVWARIAAALPKFSPSPSDVEESAQHVLRGFSEEGFVGVYRKPHRAPASPQDYPRWRFSQVNRRMRFLRYRPGDFFRPHCDGAYGEAGPAGEVRRTWFTVHLYLNDSVAGIDEDDDLSPEQKAELKQGADLVGGATEFLSSDEKRRIDIHPRAGRVLIFQHQRLYHSGADVLEGTKYTVRTDILYEMLEKGGQGEEKDKGEKKK
jgi:hypothetical protein